MLSLVVPTYNEKANISKLVKEVFSELKKHKISGEVIIVDDNSKDGTKEVLSKLEKKYPKLKVLHRKGKLGLSSAVIDGWKLAKGEILGVMDADLSHPVSALSKIYGEVSKKENELVIGSRYIPGGKIEGWGLKRTVLSKGATYLAKPFTRVRDPMSGFFMVEKDLIEKTKLDSQGFKILLEVIVKTKTKKIKEVPITFVDRIEGKSKAGTGEIFYYLKNLLGYLKYKKGLMEFLKFCVVGFLGVLVNLFVLFSFTEIAGLHYVYSAVIAFLFAMTFNYFLNKTWTFKEKVSHKTLPKYFQFGAVSIVALFVNLIVLYTFTEYLEIYYLISQALGILISLTINFLGNKLWTFAR